MTDLLMLYDAVTAANLPPGAKYACYYTDGAFSNGAAVKAQCPHATYLSITVHGGVADCCDSEVGDLTVAQAEAWVKERLAAGAWRPCVYANQSRWEKEGLLSGLASYGARIRRWVAAFPGAGPIVPAKYDAHQFDDGGGKLDTSVCLPGFFAGPPVAAHGVAHTLLSHDFGSGTWTLHSLPGVVHWEANEKWDSVEIQVCRGGANRGKWRHASLPFNAKPLGG